MAAAQSTTNSGTEIMFEIELSAFFHGFLFGLMKSDAKSVENKNCVWCFLKCQNKSPKTMSMSFKERTVKIEMKTQHFEIKANNYNEWICENLSLIVFWLKEGRGVALVAHLDMNVGRDPGINLLHGEHEPDPLSFPHRPTHSVRTNVEQFKAQACHTRKQV